MTGAVATIAVAPQTLVPIAIRYDILDEIGTFFINNFTRIRTLIIQEIIKGIATVPNLRNSPNPNLIPKKIIPNLRMYFWVKSKPIIIPGLGVNAFPIMIPSNIAIITVEIGLLEVPNSSMPITLFIPCENRQKTKASTTPVSYTHLTLPTTPYV